MCYVETHFGSRISNGNMSLFTSSCMGETFVLSSSAFQQSVNFQAIKFLDKIFVQQCLKKLAYYVQVPKLLACLHLTVLSTHLQYEAAPTNSGWICPWEGTTGIQLRENPIFDKFLNWEITAQHWSLKQNNSASFFQHTLALFKVELQIAND